MIERWISNDLTLKRWRRFKKLKRAMISVWIFAFLLFLSVTAEMWANSSPIVMSYQGKIYFPVYKYYHPAEFGQTFGAITDYRNLDWEASGNWALWPLVPWNPRESNPDVDIYPGPPSGQNWFGTDDRGRDVLARLIYGFRYSIGFALLVWLSAYTVGVIAGALMGFAGGLTDLLGQRLVEVIESMPFLIILITLVSIFGASLTVLVLLMTFFSWVGISAYMRAEFLKLRKREFVEAARSQGVGTGRIIFKHILPNGLSPLITFSPFFIASNISVLAILDYLGFGLPPPTPSWGELLQQAQAHFTIAWWLAVFPSAAMIITLTSLNLIGEGIREAFDPRK